MEKKKNRHASIPNPGNQMAVEDIKQVQEVMAREGKQLVYTHYNLVVCCDSDADLQSPPIIWKHVRTYGRPYLQEGLQPTGTVRQFVSGKLLRHECGV